MILVDKYEDTLGKRKIEQNTIRKRAEENEKKRTKKNKKNGTKQKVKPEKEKEVELTTKHFSCRIYEDSGSLEMISKILCRNMRCKF